MEAFNFNFQLDTKKEFLLDNVKIEYDLCVEFLTGDKTVKNLNSHGFIYLGKSKAIFIDEVKLKNNTLYHFFRKKYFNPPRKLKG